MKDAAESIAVGTKLFIVNSLNKQQVTVTSNSTTIFNYFPRKSRTSSLQLTKGISIKGNSSIEGTTVVDSEERLVGYVACLGSNSTSGIVFPIDYARQMAAGNAYTIEFA